MNNLELITKEVIKLAIEAGEFLKNERLSFDASKIEFKGHSSNMVSYVDKETEKLLVAGLKKILPEAGFITEEGTVAQFINEEYCWIIDPLDGTTNFLHNVPLYTTSIGLMHNHVLVAGVVYHPSQDECFYAWQNGGAWCNGKSISVSTPASLSESLIVTGFPYAEFDHYEKFMLIVDQFIKDSHGLRRTGSAALDLCWVGCGRLDAYFEFNINSYDIAAGLVIIKEAGGKMSDFKGGEDYIFGRNVIACAATIFEPCKKIIREIW